MAECGSGQHGWFKRRCGGFPRGAFGTCEQHPPEGDETLIGGAESVETVVCGEQDSLVAVLVLLSTAEPVLACRTSAGEQQNVSRVEVSCKKLCQRRRGPHWTTPSISTSVSLTGTGTLVKARQPRILPLVDVDVDVDVGLGAGLACQHLVGGISHVHQRCEQGPAGGFGWRPRSCGSDVLGEDLREAMSMNPQFHMTSHSPASSQLTRSCASVYGQSAARDCPIPYNGD